MSAETLLAILGIVLGVVGTLTGYVLAQDRRVTRLEERVRSLGAQLVALPKRKTD